MSTGTLKNQQDTVELTFAKQQVSYHLPGITRGLFVNGNTVEVHIPKAGGNSLIFKGGNPRNNIHNSLQTAFSGKFRSITEEGEFSVRRSYHYDWEKDTLIITFTFE